MATSKALVPGIYELAKRMVALGSASRPISIQEAQIIADRVCGLAPHAILTAAETEIRELA